MLLDPSYSGRNARFKAIFQGLPDSEQLVVDYSCALQKSILLKGRMYISESHIYFVSDKCGSKTILSIPFSDATDITKELPKAVGIKTSTGNYLFASFISREASFLMLLRLWHHVFLAMPMSPQELKELVNSVYGEGSWFGNKDDFTCAKKIECYDSTFSRYIQEIYNQGTTESTKTSSNFLMDDETSAESRNGCTDNFFSLEADDAEMDDPDSNCIQNIESIRGVKVKCPHKEGECTEILNAVIQLPIKHVFHLIFSDSEFFKNVLKSRGIVDLKEIPWIKLYESNFKWERKLQYTVPINNAFVKEASTTQIQRVHKDSKAGKIYSVHCEVTNKDTPYCDSYAVKLFYCLTKVSRRECRLFICEYVDFKKTVLFFKSKIETGTKDFLEFFAEDLRKALDKVSRQHISFENHLERPQPNYDLTNSRAVNDTPEIPLHQPNFIELKKSGLAFFHKLLASFNSTPMVIHAIIVIGILLFLSTLHCVEESSKQPSPANADF